VSHYKTTFIMRSVSERVTHLIFAPLSVFEFRWAVHDSPSIIEHSPEKCQH